MSIPRQSRVEAAMIEFGLDEMQALRHVQARDHVHNQLRRDPNFLRAHVARQRAEAGCRDEWMPA